MAPPTPHRGPPTGPPPPPPPPVAPYGAPGHSHAPYGPAPYGGTHPDNRPTTNPPRNWWRWAGLAAALAATIALSATATYTLTRPAPREESAATVPVSDSDAAAARQRVCDVFVIATKGNTGRGGVVVNGELNVPNVLRGLNRAVALENALSPAVPADLADATRTYITRSLDLSTAATASEPIERLNELTIASNEAGFTLADRCGVPR
jgi:hypothetical protein